MTLGRWLGFIALLAALIILWQLRQLVLLVLTAVILANALNLWASKIQKHLRVRRPYAVLLATISVFALLTGCFWLIVPSFTAQFEQLAAKVALSGEQLNGWLLELETTLDPQFVAALPDLNELATQLQPLLEELLNRGWGLFSNTLGIVLQSILVMALTLMMLADPKPYRKGFIRLFPAFYRRRVDEILVACDRDLRGWLTGLLFNMAAIGLLTFIGLLILGIPLAFAQAVLAGIFTLIPNIGPVLSAIPPIAIAFLEDPWKPLAVIILYVVIQQVESNILTPWVMAKQVSLLPAFTLLAQVFVASIFGILGLFIALPLAVIGRVWLEQVLIKDVLEPWRSPKPSPAPPQKATEPSQETNDPQNSFPLT